MAQSGSQEGPLLSGVATRYASALFEVAQQAKSVDAVAADLDHLGRMVDGSDDLQRLIRSPAFTVEQQVNAISAILDKAGISGLAANFIRLVASKRRLFVLPDMIRAFRDLVATSKGIVSAQVVSGRAAFRQGSD